MRTLSGKWGELKGLIMLHLPGNRQALALVTELTHDLEQIDPIMTLVRAIDDLEKDQFAELAVSSVESMLRGLVRNTKSRGNKAISTAAKNVLAGIESVRDIVVQEGSDDEDRQVVVASVILALDTLRESITPWMPELCLFLRSTCPCGGKFPAGSTVCAECGRIRLLCRAQAAHCRAHNRRQMAATTMTTRAQRYATAMSSDSRRALSFLEMMMDENPLTVVPELNALAARQEQLMETLGGMTYMPDVAKRISNQLDKLRLEIDSVRVGGDGEVSLPDASHIVRQVEGIVDLIDQLRDDASIWREFKSNAQVMEKMIQGQNKHAIAQQEMLSREQFRREKAALIAAVREAVMVAANRYTDKLRSANVIDMSDEAAAELCDPARLAMAFGSEIVAGLKRTEAAAALGADE